MELVKNREGYFVSDTHRECTECGVIFEKTSKMTLCKECNCKRVKSKSTEWRMHNRAKQRALSTGMEFNIEVEDIVIPAVCPILGIPMKINSHSYGRGYGPNNFSPSLDRIDNTKGYIKGNIQIISQLANKMKSDATIEQLQSFALWVNSKFPVVD
jgi:hypothetical protein